MPPCLISRHALHTDTLLLLWQLANTTNTTNDVLVNSPNWALCFLYKKFGRIWLFNFHCLIHLINSKFLITSYTILFDLCKEKLDVDKLPEAERVKNAWKALKFWFLVGVRTLNGIFWIFAGFYGDLQQKFTCIKTM